MIASSDCSSSTKKKSCLLPFSVLIMLIAALLAVKTEGKTKGSRNSMTPTMDETVPDRITSEYIRDLEERLRPALEHKIKRASRVSGSQIQRTAQPYSSPRESDFLLLARAWNNLSPEFQKLYKSALQLPDYFKSFISPGGHFEILYTTQGPDSVNPQDHYGYDPADWRNRVNSKNGIPDYIDEVAWALDSCWSQLVDRFGFIPPVAYRDARYQSEKYKVIVEQQMTGYYGLTYVDKKAAGSQKGYPSYISLRNDWSGKEWTGTGYQQRPQDGIRVTCAHELFHAVQYAMSWNVVGDIFLDDFPLSWIEGSAVLMEELTFGYINDYIQYADLYFFNPHMPFFDKSNNETIYTNSLLLLYLYKFASDTPGIDFIRGIHYANYEQTTPFHTNIRQTASSFDWQWTDLLNSFHAASFFSGSRADTGRFLADAQQFRQWSFIEPQSTLQSIEKSIRSNAMETFHLTREKNHSDTLSVLLSSSLPGSNAEHGKIWAASAIVRNNSGDTVIPIQITKQGKGTLLVQNWNTCTEIIIITTNGHPLQTGTFITSFLYCPVAYQAQSVHEIFAPESQSIARVSITAETDLHCELSLTPLKRPHLIDSARNQSLVPLTSLFEVSYPSFWNNQITNETAALSLSITTSGLLKSDSAGIYHWEQPSGRWKSISSEIFEMNDSTTFQCTIHDPTIYAVFKQHSKNETFEGNYIAYPNPVSIKKGGRIIFSGSGIGEIRIYSNDGILICRAQTSNLGGGPVERADNGSGYQWTLKNQQLRTVNPGLYTAVIQYSSNTHRLETVRRKLLVVP